MVDEAAHHETDGIEAVSLTLPANTFTDPQGQKLSYTAYQIGGNSVVGWLSFNASTDTFSGTVPLNASGQVELEVVATNTSGLSTKDLFYVSLGTSVPTVTVAHGMAVSDGSAADMEISLVGRASPHYDFHHSIV